MTIDEAIKRLKEAKKSGVNSVILAWWDAGSFPLPDNTQRKDDDEWADVCEFVETKMDWSGTHDELAEVLSVIAEVEGQP